MTRFSLCHISTVKEIKISALPWIHLGVGSLFQNVKFLVCVLCI